METQQMHGHIHKVLDGIKIKSNRKVAFLLLYTNKEKYGIIYFIVKEILKYRGERYEVSIMECKWNKSCYE